MNFFHKKWREQSWVRHQSVSEYRPHARVGKKRRNLLNHVHRDAYQLSAINRRHLARKVSLTFSVVESRIEIRVNEKSISNIVPCNQERHHCPNFREVYSIYHRAVEFVKRSND